MANVLVNDLYLGDIADAIRSKLNVQTKYKPSEMANAIGNISGGGSTPVINSLSVTENGTYTAPSGVDGYSPVTVNVPSSSPSLGTKSITENGTYNASSDSLDGYSQVTVNVSGSSPSGTKSITANGTGIDVAAYAYADVAVPNTYAAGDEGKVVSNGSLVAQTSDTVTSNGTVDTTLINSLLVNVSGGGGSAVTGTVTPSEDSRSLTIPAIAGKSNVLIFPTTDLSAVRVRTQWGGLFLNGRNILTGSTNSGGSAYTFTASINPATSSAGGGDTLDTTTGTISIVAGAGSNYGGYFVPELTYQYVAW